MRAKIPFVHAPGITFLGFALSLLLFLGAPRATPAHPEALNPGPDVIVGDLSSLQQFGSNGAQVGLAMGSDACNNGDVELNFFAMPNTDHPVTAQNLYRMSGGATNDDRFEQIGHSWLTHGFFALQSNSCGFGCTPASNGSHLGAGCSSADSASINAGPINLGSRAWVNPFTGAFPSTANSHTGHTHTGTSHRVLVNGSDLDPTMNPGAAYYAEAQFVTPHEYAWCQSHPGQCNMFNNVSYRQFNVAGTTSFTFSAVGSTVRMMPVLNAWPGATIRTIEPDPGVDGRAFLAYKVTGPVAGLYHYEYAIYNQNLDRGIQSFSVPRLLVPDINGAELGGGEQNVGFHAPPQHPGFPADGTQGNTGFSSAEWTFNPSAVSLTWTSETFAQNPNANAIRWGTLYNFRFDSTTSPVASNATVGFFKAGAPITVAIEGPAPIGGPVHIISGTVVYCSNPSLNPVPDVTLTLIGSVSGSTLSDGSGNYAFWPLINGGSYTVTPAKAGLAPGSTGINTVDVLAAQRHFLQIVPLTGCPLAAADVNGDSHVTTVDVIAIQRFFLGLSAGIANVGKYQFNPTSRSYTQLNSDQTAQNYDTIVFGDVAPPFAE